MNSWIGVLVIVASIIGFFSIDVIGGNYPPGVSIDSETDSTQPSDRTRTKLGIGEVVKLTLNPSPSSTVTWSIDEGNGALSSQTGNPVYYAAHEQADNPKITASYDNYACEVSFEVVEPTSVLMTFIGGTGGWNPLWCEMATDVFIGPEDVNFEMIEFIREGVCMPTCTGYFNQFVEYRYHMHQPGSDTTVTSSLVSGKGWKLYDQDLIRGTTLSGTTLSHGTFTWNIPWLYEINGNEYQFETVENVISLMAWQFPLLPSIQLSKAGATYAYP